MVGRVSGWHWLIGLAVALALTGCDGDESGTTTTVGSGGSAGSGAAGGQAGAGGSAGGGGAASCQDGTPLGQCAASGAAYCDATGQLIEHCVLCPGCVAPASCDPVTKTCLAPAGEVHYVSPTGTAAWTACTDEQQPCALATANSSAQAGDAVVLLAGSYAGQAIAPQHSGEPSHYVSFLARPGEAAVVGDTGSGIDLSAGQQYINVDGVRIEDVTRFWSFVGASHNVIQRATFFRANAYSGTVMEAGADFNFIVNNVFEDAPRASSCANWPSPLCDTPPWDDACDCETAPADVIRVGGGQYNLFERNRFGQSSHESLIIRNSPDESHHNVVRGNVAANTIHSGLTSLEARVLFEGNVARDGGSQEAQDNPNNTSRTGTSWLDDDANSGAPGFYLRGTRSILRRNLIVHNGRGIYLYRSETDSNPYGYFDPPNDNRVYHNTFYGNGTAFQIISDDADDADKIQGLVVKNNAFYDHGLRALLGHYLLPGGQWLDGNAFAAGDLFRWEYSSAYGDPDRPLSEMLSSFSAEFGAANREVAAGFVDAGGGDFQLLPSSPLVDQGVFLTRTRSAGSGRDLPVEDALYFYDGWGIPGEQGDRIQLEGAVEPLQIEAIDYEAHTLQVDRDATWDADQGVALVFSGPAPDIGAFELTTAASR